MDTITPPGLLIVDRLKAELDGEVYRDWFQGARIELSGDRLTVTVGTQLTAQVIRQNFTDTVKAIAAEVIGGPISAVNVTVSSQEPVVDVAPIEKILRAVASDDAQPDFFIPELSELAIKDDVHLMEMTPFTLNQRTEDRKELVYKTPQGVTIRVKTEGEFQLPSIDDYDLVLMMQTWLADLANQYRSQVERYESEKKAGREAIVPVPPSRMFEVSISEVVKFKRMKWGGTISDDVLGSLDRLFHAYVTIDPQKGTKYRGGKFRLVGSSVEKMATTPQGKATRVRVSVPDWIYEGIVERAVPTLRTFSRDYMILAQPMHRALYRLLTLKVPKDGKPYTVSLVELAQRFQTKQPQKYFNRDVKKAVLSCPNGRLLEYGLELVGKGDDRVLRAPLSSGSNTIRRWRTLTPSSRARPPRPTLCAGHLNAIIDRRPGLRFPSRRTASGRTFSNGSSPRAGIRHWPTSTAKSSAMAGNAVPPSLMPPTCSSRPCACSAPGASRKT